MSLLQTTSYLFIGTENTPVTCVGVVKRQKNYPKHPEQHAADLNILGSHAEVKLLMEGKKIECIRVDGAMDESPFLFKKSNFSGLKDTLRKGHCAQLLHQDTVVAAILIKLSFKMAA